MEQNRTRLAKLLEELGSPHEGEIVAAATAAEALVREEGLTWFDIVGGVPDCHLDWQQTKKGGVYIDLPSNKRIVVFEKELFWKFVTNTKPNGKPIFDPRVFHTMETAIAAAEESYFKSIERS